MKAERNYRIVNSIMSNPDSLEYILNDSTFTSTLFKIQIKNLKNYNISFIDSVRKYINTYFKKGVFCFKR